MAEYFAGYKIDQVSFQNESHKLPFPQSNISFYRLRNIVSFRRKEMKEREIFESM